VTGSGNGDTMRDRIAAARHELEATSSAETSSDAEDSGDEVDGDAEAGAP
jgi:hypothetical protein